MNQAMETVINVQSAILSGQSVLDLLDENMQTRHGFFHNAQEEDVSPDASTIPPLVFPIL